MSNNTKDIESFYIGAALFLDLDGPEVDAILQAANLDPATSPVQDCVVALRAYALDHAPTWLTVAEAVVISGIPERTIRLACERGLIPDASQVSRREWRFSKASLEDWLNHRPKRGRPPKQA